MNRTGLVIALAVAAAVGLVFGIRPDLDLKLAALFFDPERGGFWRAYDPTYLRARDVAVWLTTLVAMPASIALALKFVRPRRPLLIPGRAIVLMLVTLALAPGVVANLVLKEHWGRRAPSTWPSSVATNISVRGGTRAAIVRRIAPSSPASRRVRSGLWPAPRWCRRNGARSAMAARSPSAPPWACCAWRRARISSATWCSPACSAFC